MKILLSFALVCCLADTAWSDDLRAPFTLAVVPSRSSLDERSVATASKQPETFYVVLTNTSDRAQPIWQRQSSWGFWTISFDLTMPSGEHVHITRNHKEAFTKNSPAIFLIPPGQQYVYPIQLDGQWDNVPHFLKSGSDRITLRAIYEVGPTPEATQQNIWLGRIDSSAYDWVLRHW